MAILPHREWGDGAVVSAGEDHRDLALERQTLLQHTRHRAQPREGGCRLLGALDRRLPLPVVSHPTGLEQGRRPHRAHRLRQVLG